MKKISFWTLFAVLQIAFIFTKIYQHNRYTSLLYTNQRLAEEKKKVALCYNNELLVFFKLKNSEHLAQIGEGQKGMKSIALHHVITLKEREEIHETRQ